MFNRMMWGRVDRYCSGLCSTGGCGGGWIDTVVDYVQPEDVGEGWIYTVVDYVQPDDVGEGG